MLDDELLIVVHFGGQFEWDRVHPNYIGGDQTAIYVSCNLTYTSLVESVIQAINWVMSEEPPRIQYLHQNGKAFTLISIKNDNDTHVMVKACGEVTNSIYIYLSRNINDGADHYHSISWNEQVEGTAGIINGYSCYKNPIVSRPRTHATKHKKSKAIDHEGPPSRGLTARFYCLGKSPMNFDVDAMSDVYRAEMGNIREYTYPDVNLGEDTDKHFSYPTNEVASETNASPEDYSDDIDFNDDLDDVLNQDESDSDCNSACTSHDSVRCVNGLSYQQEVSECNKQQSNTMQKYNIEDTLVPVEDEGEDFVTQEDSAHNMWNDRTFTDRNSFRKTLSKFAIYTNFSLRHLKTSRTQVTAKCEVQSCLWRIHASIVESGPQFRVRTYNPNHTCSRPMMGMAHPQATANLIANFIKEKIRLHHEYKSKQIINDVKLEFGVVVCYRKAHRAKEIALDAIRGSYEQSFRILPNYCAELMRTNPKSHYHLDIDRDCSFLKFFFAFGSSLQSFKTYMRTLIAIDGVHLRGKYPGVLFVVVTQDSNYGLFPIAFAIAEIERYDTWVWFLSCFKIALGPLSGLTIVSDRQKGLVEAVKNVYPNANHCYCCRHIAENVRERFKDRAIVSKFWCAAKSCRSCDYKRHMNDLRNVNEEAYAYIENIGKERWANTFVHAVRYDMLTTNSAECTYSLLKDIRDLPITRQVEEIRVKIMNFFQLRRDSSQLIESRLTPYFEKNLSKEKDGSRRLHARQAGPEEYQIDYGYFIDVVHLDRRSCTCRQWDLMGIPCSHAMSTISYRCRDPYDFYEEWFSAETYCATYSQIVHATTDI